MSEPLLSEAGVERMLDKHDYRCEMDAMKELWRFYEDKIASGELVKRKDADEAIAECLALAEYCQRHGFESGKALLELHKAITGT